MGEGLTFEQLRAANVQRCESTYHLLKDWSLTDWATAAAGEVGEACNVVKKLRRFGANPTDVIHPEEREQIAALVADLAAEAADAVICLDLLTARAGIDLGEAVRAKFNVVSDRVGSEVRL